MSEERTSNLSSDSTNHLPMEELLKRHFDVVVTRLDQVETQLTARIERVETQLTARIDQIGKEVRDLRMDVEGVKAHLLNVEERIRHLDHKVDAFVRESLFLKRELQEFQESVRAKQ
jgi:FtsZ-binding cell division protein ZapB